ncbi:MAG: hypothetical protein WBE20_02205 [Candidatus Acidiferrales bacterium]
MPGEDYRKKIQARLTTFTVSALASALGLSKPYATDIRKGKRLPHPRHWMTIAKLISISSNAQE